MFINSHYSGIRAIALIVALLPLAGGCGAHIDDTGTETHWLRVCDADSDCNGPTSCLCGVCTITCEAAEMCPQQAPVCSGWSENACASAQTSFICLGANAASPGEDAGLVSAGAGTTSTADGPTNLVAPPVEVNVRPPSTVAPCDNEGWCWQTPSAPGERFTAFSDNGRYAVGELGVVFDTTGVYLPRPSRTDLLAVTSHEDSLWVGGVGGTWQKTTDGWQQQTDAWVTDLAVAPSGELWAINTGTLLRWDSGTWDEVSLPVTGDGAFVLSDLAVLDDDRVWVLGGYWRERLPHGTLFTLENGEWNEYPADQATGTALFLSGPDVPYVYNATANDEVARVFDPKHAWSVVASDTVTFPGGLFWGPDQRVWWSSEQRMSAFNAPEAPLSADIACVRVITWDDNTSLCAATQGGLKYVDISEEGQILGSSPFFPFEPYDPATFGTLPTPVWAATPEAWAASADDVWRAPLNHFDGEEWQTQLTSGDTFSAIQIEGTATDDVWFVGTTELRHWDGAQITTVALPSTSEGSEILSVRAVAADDVWLLRRTLLPTTTVEVLHFDGAVWQSMHALGVQDDFGVAMTHEVVHATGAIVGTSDNLWVAFGQTVLHFDGNEWTTAWTFEQLDSSNASLSGVLHAATDGDELWVLTEIMVYQLSNGEMIERGYRTGLLQHLALSPDFVWNFEPSHVRQLSR